MALGGFGVGPGGPDFGQAGGERRGGQAAGHAHPTDQVVAPGGEKERGCEPDRELGQEAHGGDAAVDEGVALGHAGRRQAVVEQGFERTGAERAAEAPKHEATGKGPVPGGGDPERVSGGLEQARGQQKGPPREPVGQGARRHLGHDAHRRPDEEKSGDLRIRQPAVGEQQRVERIDGDAVGEQSPADREPVEPASLRRERTSTMAHGSQVSVAGVTQEVWAIVVAGGSGSRFGRPKQFEDLLGRRVLDWSMAAARAACDGVVAVLPPDRLDPGAQPGGVTRSASVRAGLAAVPATADIVVVHDAARPLAGPEVFERVVAAVGAGADGAVPGVALPDTVKRVEGRRVTGTVDRRDLVAVQTPQGFRAEILRQAHAGAAEATDDAALVEAMGGTVVVVEGDRRNFKITSPDDLVVARALLADGPARMSGGS